MRIWRFAEKIATVIGVFTAISGAVLTFYALIVPGKASDNLKEIYSEIVSRLDRSEILITDTNSTVKATFETVDNIDAEISGIAEKEYSTAQIYGYKPCESDYIDFSGTLAAINERVNYRVEINTLSGDKLWSYIGELSENQIPIEYSTKVSSFYICEEFEASNSYARVMRTVASFSSINYCDTLGYHEYYLANYGQVWLDDWSDCSNR